MASFVSGALTNGRLQPSVWSARLPAERFTPREGSYAARTGGDRVALLDAIGRLDHRHRGFQDLRCGDLPHLVGEPDGLADLLIAESRLTRLRNVIFDARNAVAS